MDNKSSVGLIKVQDGDVFKNYYELGKEKPVLINFSGSTCGPCQRIAPALETFAYDIQSKCVVIKTECGFMDNIQNPEFFYQIVKRYNIKALPSFVLLRPNEPVKIYITGAKAHSSAMLWVGSSLELFNTSTAPSDL